MISAEHLSHWRNKAPWAPDYQTEQDLVLTKAIIQLYSDPLLTNAFAFRGGTAMQKIFFDPPNRYSEDIDLVQVRAEPIGPAIDKIRALIDPWLGKPSRDLKNSRATLIYRFDSEMPPSQRMRLKIEINTGEHFTILKTIRRTVDCDSPWFKGSAEVLTYELEELMGTKMRALYQRKKGRDLYDLAMVLQYFPKLDFGKTVHCFQKYMQHEGASVTRAQYEENLAGKLKDPAFLNDVQQLLAPAAPIFDPVAEYKQVEKFFLSLLPGEPWKNKTNAKKKK